MPLTLPCPPCPLFISHPCPPSPPHVPHFSTISPPYHPYLSQTHIPHLQTPLLIPTALTFPTFHPTIPQIFLTSAISHVLHLYPGHVSNSPPCLPSLPCLLHAPLPSLPHVPHLCSMSPHLSYLLHLSMLLTSPVSSISRTTSPFASSPYLPISTIYPTFYISHISPTPTYHPASKSRISRSFIPHVSLPHFSPISPTPSPMSSIPLTFPTLLNVSIPISLTSAISPMSSISTKCPHFTPITPFLPQCVPSLPCLPHAPNSPITSMSPPLLISQPICPHISRMSSSPA